MSFLLTVQRSLKWSILAEVVSKAVGPCVFLALARILTPEDFGVVGAATLVVSFSQAFWEAGLGKALIQRPEAPEKTATTVFWLNLGFSLVIAAILVAAAGFIAGLFHDPRITNVVRLLALQLPLAAFGSVQTALLQKSFQFKKLFWVRIITTAAPGILSVPIAIAGGGYWALIAGTLFGAAAQSSVLWFLSPWRPERRIDPAMARSLLGFGLWVMAEGLLGWFYMWGDGFLVGMFLGTRDLGVYRTGSVLVALVFALALSPALPVIYSAFSRIQADSAQLVRVLLRTQKALFTLALPLGLGLFLLRDSTAGLVFGDKWEGVGIVLGILGLIQGLSWLMGANAEAYKAMNRPDIFTKIMVIGLTYYLPVYYFSLRHGIEFFLWSRLGLFLFSQTLHFIALKKCLGVGPLRVFSNSAKVFGAAAIYVAIYLVFDKMAAGPLAMLPEWLENLVRVAIFGFLVAVTYFFTMKNDFVEILGEGFLKFGRKKAPTVT
jgi:O-antigen/teichoic acid export membrane protein